MLYEHAGQFFFVVKRVSFVITGGRSWSFQTPNLEVFKTKQEKLFGLISIILCADSSILCIS